MIRGASLPDTITVFATAESGDEDRYGDPTKVEATGVDTRAQVTPLAETENEISEDVRVSRYRVIVLPDVTIDALARVEWRSRSFQVVGEPQVFIARRGAHHLEFDMREVKGG